MSANKWSRTIPACLVFLFVGSVASTTPVAQAFTTLEQCEKDYKDLAAASAVVQANADRCVKEVTSLTLMVKILKQQQPQSGGIKFKNAEHALMTLSTRGHELGIEKTAEVNQVGLTLLEAKAAGATTKELPLLHQEVSDLEDRVKQVKDSIESLQESAK